MVMLNAVALNVVMMTVIMLNVVEYNLVHLGETMGLYHEAHYRRNLRFR